MMSNCSRRHLLLPWCALVIGAGSIGDARRAGAQATPPTPAKATKGAKATKAAADTGTRKPKVSKLFKSETPPVAVTLAANWKQIKREKQDDAPLHPATLSYVDSTGRTVDIPLRVRTRGIWRLRNCDFPPLRLNFTNKTSKATLFDDLDEPKLVSYCKSGSGGEELLLRELQLYRVYRILTPVSHETRLLRVTYVDSATGKPEVQRYAFMVEDPARMAERLGGRMLKLTGAKHDDVDPAQAALLFLFQYMIGNTDFSLNALHNGELVANRGGDVFPVAYDFDYAGAVDAPYAVPPDGLHIKTVRQRQFRGYCAIRSHYPAAIAIMQQRKDAIYALYRDAIGSLLPERTVRETLQYFDEFYNDVKTPRDFERRLFTDCVDIV
jgi:hypothetical protein